MPKYAIIGIGKKGIALSSLVGKQVYMDIDTHSGGYPYWTDRDNFRRYDSPEAALNALNCDYMYEQASDIQVVTVELVFNPVSKVNPDTTRLAKRISEAEREVDRCMGLSQAALKNGSIAALEKTGNDLQSAIRELSQLKKQLAAMTS